MFDAYTIKKVLPRLVIAIILIQLSWFIFTGLISITNTIAYGLEGLIYAPFGGRSELTLVNAITPPDVPGGGIFMGAAVVGAGVGAFALGGLLALAGVALIAIFIAFGLLLFRQVLIVALLLLSPLALVAWILPNTEKYWKLWWENFSKLLLLYPIILVVIAVGRVFGSIVSGIGTPETDSSGNLVLEVGSELASPIVSVALIVIAFFGPFFLIPKMFQMAGSAFATASGFAQNNGLVKGSQGWLRKRGAETRAKNKEAIQQGKRWTGTRAGRRLSRSLQTASLVGEAGMNPMRMRGKIRAARSERGSALASKAGESEAVQTVAGNDDLLTASLHGNGTDADARTYLQGLGQTGAMLEQNVESIRRAKDQMGQDNFHEFAVAAVAGTGTGFADGPGEMMETINRVAGNDRAKATRMLNASRQQAEKARRVDLYGAGFGASAGQLELLHEGRISTDQADETLTDAALQAKGSGEVASARHGGLVNMLPAMQRRLLRAEQQVQAAHATGDQAQVMAAERSQKQVLAESAAFQDIAAQVSPENSTAIADGLLAMPVSYNGTTTTALNHINDLRGDHEFQQKRREYADSGTASARSAAAAAAAAAAGTPVGGGPPTIGPPAGGPPAGGP